MSRFSPTVLPNYGQAVGEAFAGAIRGLDYEEERKRREAQDARQAEFDAMARRRYALEEVDALADLADRGIVEGQPTVAARDQMTPEQSRLFDGAQMGMATIGQQGPSPLAVAGSPRQLASILQAQTPDAAPELAVRAGQFVPGQGFAAGNIFRQRDLSRSLRSTQYADPNYQQLGETGFWRGPQEQAARGFEYDNNLFPDQDAAIEYAGRLARAQYPQRFEGAGPEGTEPWEPQTREEQIAFEREMAAARRAPRTGPGAPTDPLAVQRYMAQRELVGDVRDVVNEAQKWRSKTPEELDVLVRSASGGMFQSYQEFSLYQRALLAEEGMTSAAGGGVGTVDPGGEEEPGGQDYTDEELDAALEASGYDVDAALKLLESRGG